MILNSIKEKFKWIMRRHPFLYYARFAMVSKNHKGDLDNLPVFNDINKKEEVGQIYFDANTRIPFSNDRDSFGKAKSIAIYLKNKQVKGSPGLGLSSDKSLEMLLKGNGGVCSDHSQIFNVFCVVNDIKVREWGIVDRFYNPQYGHTFNEIYSEGLQKWILMDVWMGITFNSAEISTPFSTMELFEYLRNGNTLNYTRLANEKTDISRIFHIYSANSKPFIITNYNNLVYDNYLNRFQHRLPSFMINAMMILAGKNYSFLFVMDNYKSALFPFLKKTD